MQELGEDEEEVGLGHRLPEHAETGVASSSERQEAGWMLINSAGLIKEMLFNNWAIEWDSLK